MPFRAYLILASLTLGVVLLGGAARAESPTDEFTRIRDRYIEQVRPLEIEAGLAWWEASTTGSEAAYSRREQADNAMAALHGDRAVFARLKALRTAGALTDPVMKRELEVMYRTFLPYQADAELTRRIIAREAEVDKIFNTHRSLVRGQRLTENDVRKILSTTADPEEARQAWLGYMEVGRKVAGPLKDLVGLRNQVAQKLGYRNYFQMKLDIQEYDEEELLALFDDLDALTRDPFRRLKADIDAHMADRFKVSPNRLRPWLLGDLFFQEAPELTAFSMDSLYEERDPVKLSQAHYASFGMEVADILGRSDLYERPGKDQHAFRCASTATRTSGCCATCAPTPRGWTRCTTSWDTGSTTSTSARTSPTCCTLLPTY